MLYININKIIKMAKKLSKKARKQEIIDNLKHTIEVGGNPINIDKLKEILKAVEEDTHIVKKRPGRRKPLKKKEKKDE